MKLTVKQLKHNNEVFVPQTTAEAVLVKDKGEIKQLHIVLDQKIEEIETPEDSGLEVTRKFQKITITHTNNVEPVQKELTPLLIKHDNTGHITESTPVKKLKIIVDKEIHIEHDGSQEQVLQMGDDFTLDENNKIKLNWNNL